LYPQQFTLGLEDVRVYTFGSPRVGNDVFATFFDNEIKARSCIVLAACLCRATALCLET